MQVDLQPGSYVVAVSGGVDSVALLDVVQALPDVRLTVAHFDHGIRENSAEDRRFVQRIALGYGLPFVYGEGQLGGSASEALARQARYAFLHGVRAASRAQAVITAHHQDDALETAIINILRGTGRSGLTALKDRVGIRRPLLQTSKRTVRDYALAQGLEWREDSTNRDTTYLRNYVRHNLLPRFNDVQRQQFVTLLQMLAETNQQLDNQLINYLHLQPAARTLSRPLFAQLPHNVAREVLASWLRQHGLGGFEAKALERLVVAAKTARPGSRVDIYQSHVLHIGRDDLTIA